MPTAASESVLSRYMVSCATENFSNFFCFDSSTKLQTFFRCQHISSPPARYALSVADLSGHSTMDSIARLRPVCETIFYFLLSRPSQCRVNMGFRLHLVMFFCLLCAVSCPSLTSHVIRRPRPSRPEIQFARVFEIEYIHPTR